MNPSGQSAEKSPFRSATDGTVDEVGLPLAVPETLEIGEEESLVLANRTAKRGAKLVLFQGLRPGGEIVCGVKSIVAQKFPKRSVEPVRAGTGNDVGGRAQTLSELRAGIVRKNSELGDGIHGRLENKASIHSVEVIGSVDEKIVGLGPLAIHRVCLTLA